MAIGEATAESAGAKAGAGAAGRTHDPLDVPLRRNRDFLILLCGQSLAALGDAVTLTAMPLLVLQLTGSGVAMGIVGVLGTVPDLIFGLPSGVLADRMDRKRLMMVSDAARAGLTALIPLSVVHRAADDGGDPPGHLSHQRVPRAVHGRLDGRGPEPRQPPAARLRGVGR